MRLLGLAVTIITFLACNSEGSQAERSISPKDTSFQTVEIVQNPEANQISKANDTTVGIKTVTDDVRHSDDNSERPLNQTAVKSEHSQNKSKDQTSKSIPLKREKPVIAFEELYYDFGRIVQGEKVVHEFKFTNLGKTPIEIKSAEASCGCTQPIFPFMPIAPGEKGTILVQFNSKGRLGQQSPKIEVTSNADPSKITLNLKGEVITEAFLDTIQ